MKWWDWMPWSSFSECWALSQLFHFHQEAFEFLFTFCHKCGVICISEFIDISPGNLDSSLGFFQSSISHDVLCIEVKKAGWQYTALTYSFSYLEPVCCSMSSSNCCFLTCIQISQEAGQVVWYSHLSQDYTLHLCNKNMSCVAIVAAEILTLPSVSWLVNFQLRVSAGRSKSVLPVLHWNLRTSMSSIFLSQLKKISEMNICLLNIGFYSWEVNVPSLHSWKFTICLLSVGCGISIDITHLILMESWEYHLWQPGYLLWLNGLPCQWPIL